MAAQSAQQIGVSAITLLEMVYLVEKKRVAIELFSIAMRAISDPNSVFHEVTLSSEIARIMNRVPAHQVPDLPDRIIAATAAYLKVPIISRDGWIRSSSLQTIW